MDSRKAAVAVNLPLYNERQALEQVIPTLLGELRGRRHTICVVDGGSSDGTQDYVRRLAQAGASIVLLERPKPGPGCHRGDASRAGLEWLVANTDATVFVDLDGDGSQPPGELSHGVDLVASQRCDVVVASKYVAGAVAPGRPLVRRFASFVYNALVRAIAGTSLRDHSNTYRFYNRRAAELALSFAPLHTGPLYMLEMLLHWVDGGLAIVEVPTRYGPRLGGDSKVGAGDLVAGFWGAVRVAAAFRLTHLRRRCPG
ncbi:MAG: glycosyltransferase [Deltaproteobacteria bacterium]|nr:glycosyltransferase [Deltaproteobacteria bacterium]